jgi:hypothetical protein
LVSNVTNIAPSDPLGKLCLDYKLTTSPSRSSAVHICGAKAANVQNHCGSQHGLHDALRTPGARKTPTGTVDHRILVFFLSKFGFTPDS